MSVLWTTLRKELMSYLFSPVGYVIAFLLYLFRGLETSMVIAGIASIGGDRDQFYSSYVLQLSSLVMILLVPAVLTMRTFAEEQRTGSLEVLLTAPVREWEVVVGKWLAAFVYFVLLWIPTLLLLEVLTAPYFLDAPVEYGPVVSGYIGLFCVAAMLLAAGVFTSSLSDNLLLASLSSILLAGFFLLGPYFLGQLVLYLPEELHPAAAQILNQVDMMSHLNRWFNRGLVDSSQVVFYLAGTVFFLFLTTKLLEGRRWR